MANRIYVTGDTHREFYFRCEDFKNLVSDLDKSDYLIVCGDFGLIWDTRSTSRERYEMNFLNDMPWTTLFVDGNHECINKCSDILTEHGWMNIVDVYNSNVPIKLATYDISRNIIRYLYPKRKIRTYSKTIIDIIGKNYKQSVTPNHDVLIDGKKVKANILIGTELREYQLRHKVNNDSFVGYSREIIQLLTCIAMDGTIVDYKKYSGKSNKIRIQFHLKKQRKIDYMIHLLNSLNIPFTIHNGSNDDTYVCIYGAYGRRLYELLDNKKQLPSIFAKLSDEEFSYFLDALVNTDGHMHGNCIRWTTTSKNDVDIVQEACIRNNYDCSCWYNKNPDGYNAKNKLPQYIILIGKKLCNHTINITEYPYNDYAYCFEMSGTGTLISRYDNCVCITGNCHTRLNQDFPVVDFHGGKAHKISDSIYHLMRGEMYDIYGNKIFTFGGARSHDIWNLLDPQSEDYNRKKANFDYVSGEFYREIGISWWEDEVATSEELRHGWETLKLNNWRCDYIITHEAPLSDIYAYYKNDTRDSGVMAEYLEAIKQSVDFKLWYYGHHHISISADPKTQCLFESIKELGEKSEQIVDNVITEHVPFSQRHLLQLIDKMEQEREDVLNGKFQIRS